MIPKHKKASYFRTKGLFSDLLSFKELENRIANLPETERGDAFEVFAEAYLKTQPIHQVEEIWPEKSLPQSLRELLNIMSDAGIDGVFKTSAGHYKAYQVKFRSNRGSLSWGGDSLGNFFGQADRVSERVLFTNSMDLSDLAASRINFYSIKGNELDCLELSDFKAIEDWLKTGVVRRKMLEPKEHQQQAINAIIDELSVKDRATAIMACGTGKTLVALKVAEKIKAETILVLLPSLALIRQTLHDWARNHNWLKFNFLCVCSDDTVVQGQAETVLSQRDLDFTVTTQPEEIAAFLNNSNVASKIIFSTYQSCRMVAQAMPGNFVFDLAIFDEAHKTASRLTTNHAFALSENNIAIKKRLFLTATPRHYNIDAKDKFGENQLVFSMDDETIYGRAAYKLSFRAAVEQGLICDYKVVISVITSDTLNRELLKRGEVPVGGDIIKAQRIANILAIQNAVEQYGVKRIFSFHSSISAAKSFTAKTNEGIGAYLTDFATMHVSGEMSSSKRDAILSEFRGAERALVSNARCLTEGVNVPAVDMVAFVSPKKSKVDIVQAAGRAMRKHPGKERGYILVPLFVQITEQEELEQALAKTKFDTVWDVLQAMCEQDEILVEIIAKLRENRGKALGINDNRLRDIIEVLGPELLLVDLRNAITTNIIDNLGSSWDERFGQLIRFKELFEHCNVPQAYLKNPDLGIWVSVQRWAYKRKKISLERIKKLESIGFEWNKNHGQWEYMFTVLCDYYKNNNDCLVPRDYSEDSALATWVADQRKMYNKGKLSHKRIAKLETIGFDWNPLDKAWDTRFDELCAYREKHGNNKVRKLSEHHNLAIWMQHQRIYYREGRLPVNRIARLESIDFNWDPLNNTWNTRFAELRRYYDVHNDCNVPHRYSKNLALGLWVQNQRKYYKNGKLSPDRINRLNEIGFLWKR
jgi:superfamily II DNA or RNA helicase